jgi:hypothetical protein
MVSNPRKATDQSAFALQRVSVGRMLEQAKVLHEQGKLRKVTPQTSRVRSKAEPLRVQAVNA